MSSIVAVYARRAGRGVKDKGTFYQDIQTAVTTRAKYEINIFLGDFNEGFLERSSRQQIELACIFWEDTNCTERTRKNNRSRFIIFCQDTGFFHLQHVESKNFA